MMQSPEWRSPRRPILNLVTALALLIGAMLPAGCSFGNLPGNLSQALLDQPDPETVRDGAPAYLVLIDTLINADPEDVGRLTAGAQLYTLYATAFVDEKGRRQRLAGRAREYGSRALCAEKETLCDLSARPFPEFIAGLGQLDDPDQVPALYALTIGWLAWIEAHSDDWGAIADLPKVEAALSRLLALDEGYRGGSVHTLLGILLTLRPPALGGQPEVARAHFERALELSGGRDLGVKLELARSYARLVYERDLHDRLLQEVLAADPRAPGLTLTNTLAQRQARELLASADLYF